MSRENLTSPLSGYLMVGMCFLALVGAFYGIAVKIPLVIAPCLLTAVIIGPGFFFVNPNESRVLVLFGEYVGTVKKNGFFWVNPFYVKKKISLRARNFDSKPVKVNDKLGNPIMIGAILVWKVADTFKAAFEVDDFVHFVNIQSDAAIRKLAGSYPYDNFEDHEAESPYARGLPRSTMP